MTKTLMKKEINKAMAAEEKRRAYGNMEKVGREGGEKNEGERRKKKKGKREEKEEKKG